MGERTKDELAQLLARARRERYAVDAAGWDAVIADAADAYAVQQQVAIALDWFHDGTPLAWKSGGGTREAVLTHAPLPPEGVRRSPAMLADMHFNLPGVEAEIALQLGCDVGPEQAASLTHETAEALIDAMAVSIEIVDARWRDYPRVSAPLRLADSQVHGALVLGDWVPYVRGHDWAAQACEARIGDRTIVKTGTHPLGEPAWLLPAWLKHATRDGTTLRSGTVVTTGTWIGIAPVQRAEVVVVNFPGIGRAELST